MLQTDSLLNDRYRIVSSIASGGMADVYEAYDERLGRSVAVKVLRTSDPGLTRRFADEVRTLAKLNDAGIVALYDADQFDSHPFFVMELVRGRPLSDVLAEGPLDPSTVASIAQATCRGLAQAHGNGIVHRDIKPANIMVTPDGKAKLADFGIARMTEQQSDLTQSGTVIGTAAYLSPEQAEGREVGPATDVYSLGLVLIECLTGRRVFEGTATEAVVARLTRDPDVPEDLSGNWTPILRAMTARHAQDRPFAETLAPLFGSLAAGDTVALPGAAAATAVMGGAAAAGMAGADVGSPAAGATQMLPAEGKGGVPGPIPPEVEARRRNLAIVIAVLVGLLLVGGIAWAITSGQSTETTTSTAATTTTAAPTTAAATTTTTEPTTTSRTTTSTTTTTKATTTTKRTTTSSSTTSTSTTSTTTTTTKP